MIGLIDLRQRIGDPSETVAYVENLAAILADLGEHVIATRMLGAADAKRARNAMPRLTLQDAEIAAPLGRARAALATDVYDHDSVE